MEGTFEKTMGEKKSRTFAMELPGRIRKKSSRRAKNLIGRKAHKDAWETNWFFAAHKSFF